ncbi:ATP-dependent DNA ligase [Flavisphingomonas formosensis]|uniref:ATP-dependent DNA ligase n=1 Tax=Flavisphingomonas formosensis TaxID=861534 RepID=UPI0018E02BCD|nr:ATP-dependent DNA ligase [Sphingomonas formosensis]
MDAIPSPMEALLVEQLPEGEGWQYEPKWDGFRALAGRDGDEVSLISRSGKSLGRYFPEIVAMMRAVQEHQFLLDGELVIAVGQALSFGALQARLHPAASRIERLARETPACLILFDCLNIGGHDFSARPLAERRTALEAFMKSLDVQGLLLSPASEDPVQARRWLARAGGALDGIVAKRTDLPYRNGQRAMLKIKQYRTADCVVGGFRTTAGGKAVASLLLGLYGEDGRLDHVGFTSAFPVHERVALARKLAPYAGGQGFTGNAPGGPSRWNGGKAKPWTPLRPELVVEVGYDQVTDDRFRHGTRFLRWRPDKDPISCDRSQLIRELRPADLAALTGRDAAEHRADATRP